MSKIDLSFKKKLASYDLKLIDHYEIVDSELRDMLVKLKALIPSRDELIANPDKELGAKQMLAVQKGIKETLSEIRHWTKLYQEASGRMKKHSETTNINLIKIESLHNKFKDVIFRILEHYPEAKKEIAQATAELLLNGEM